MSRSARPATEFSTKAVIESLPWYERAIQAVAPSWGYSRLQARVSRHLFEYQAAKTDRLFQPASSSAPAESSRLARDRIVMMYEARDLVENFESAKTALGKFAAFTVPTEWSPNTGDAKYDAVLHDWFHDWCKRCDLTGRHSFRVMLELATQMQPVDGDCGFVQRATSRGLRLQLVPADLIGNPQEVVNDSRYFSGVAVDNHGAPVRYDIWRRTNEGVYEDKEPVPAGMFRHYFNPFRVDQYRGITEFHSVLRTARMIKETLEAERVAQRHKSQHAAIVFNERGQAPSRQAFNPTPAVTLPSGENQLQEYSGVGTILYMARGDKVETMPARPGEGFMDFVDYGDRLIARGLDIPYGVLFGTNGYKGPNVRAEFAQADRVFDRRRNLLCTQVADPLKDAAILDAIARKELPLPPLQSGENAVDALIRATRGEWRFPAKPSIDAGRDSAANLNENRQGIKSATMIGAESGYDWNQQIEQIAKEAALVKELAKKYDVPETALRLPTQSLPNTPASAAILGEEAGKAAAEAQKQSVNPPKPAEKQPENTPEKGEEMSVKDVLSGAKSRKNRTLGAMLGRHERLSAVRARVGAASRKAEQVQTTFARLGYTPPAPKPADPNAPKVISLAHAREELRAEATIDERLSKMAEDIKAKQARASASGLKETA